jgi:two-component system, chemotaxis family, sensor kinase CheA
MKNQLDEETREILSSFVAEGYERLDDAEVQISRLAEQADIQALNSVFRLFHSVKGSAGYLGLENIKELTHEAETLLDIFIKGKAELSPNSLDLIFATVDILRELVALVEKEFSDKKGEKNAKAQSAVIRSHIQEICPPETSPSDVAKKTETIRTASSSPEEALASETITADATQMPNEVHTNSLVTEDMIRSFLEECQDLLDRSEQKAMAIQPRQANKDAVHDIFRAIHTIKGNAGFFGYQLLERICMDFETRLDGWRKKEGPLGENASNEILLNIDILRKIIASVIIHDGPQQKIEPKAPEPVLAVQKPKPVEYRPVGKILVDMGVVEEDVVQDALNDQERPIGEILVQKGLVKPEQIQEALSIQQASKQSQAAEGMVEVIRREIRVDTQKLDKLFELVGELITAESMVINSPDLHGLRLDSFTKAFASLNKISREIQETTMMIRMIPLEGLFHKMSRLVRDLSRKMNKPVSFDISGQETEMDKNVIEQIADPLVHIIRNAIDHGIEDGETRKTRGKNETGTLSLSARYEGSEIWISIRDDGAGLNKERILEKAIERGLIKGNPEELTDKEIYAFIMEAGFSTAKAVSEVSGRGVGMDVVKKNLEQVHGRIDIHSTPGEGTEFVLAIPLTMAIIDGITVRVGSNRYSLPLNDIIEFFKIDASQVSRGENSSETVNIRKEFLPLVKLGEVFDVPDAVKAAEDGIVILVNNAGRRACLLIDEVIGNQQIVVKSLSGYLGKIDGISGCSILGDGGVSFIIDTGKLLSLRLE